MAYLSLALLWVLLAPAHSRFALQPGPFLKLPDGHDHYELNSGAANKAAYDPQENFLYVVGYEAEVLHVINMTDPNTPVLLTTKDHFSLANAREHAHGHPDSIRVCRGGTNREYLSVTFEAEDLDEQSHVHFFQLLDAGNYGNDLVELKQHATLEGFDPKGSAWKKDCSEVVVVSTGLPHELNNNFVDPPPTVDRLIPSFGSTVDKVKVPIRETLLEPAGVRYVFQQCDGGSQVTSSREQDLQATAVTVDKDNKAYIIFQDNNAIGTLDLTDPFADLTFHSLGYKDWRNYELDGSYDDGGMVLKPRIVRSFYQAGDVVSFELDGKVWLATADTGSFRSLNLTTCTFDESVAATDWNQLFTNNLTSQEQQQLRADMNDVAEIGRLRVSKLRTRTDGYNPSFLGYDFVCTYGGRGFSILDPADMRRVYDSGDDFERYFTTSDATEPQRAVYNAFVDSAASTPSSTMDRASPDSGPSPSVLTVADISSTTQVLVIANGEVGGLYTYSVSSPGPVVTFEGFTRRGQAGLSWTEAYARNDDAVGEPYTTDLIYFEDQGQKTVVAVSSYAGAISVYRLEEIP